MINYQLKKKIIKCKTKTKPIELNRNRAFLFFILQCDGATLLAIFLNLFYFATLLSVNYTIMKGTIK
jgi:hypothetical protein